MTLAAGCEPSDRVSYVVTDSYGSGFRGVVGIGVAFRGGRIICGDIAEAPDFLTGELLAILRAAEISSRITWRQTVIYTDHEPAAVMATDPKWAPESEAASAIQGLLDAHDHITVEYAPWEAVRAARIVARQTFKAWRCSFEAGVTWVPAAQPEAVGA